MPNAAVPVRAQMVTQQHSPLALSFKPTRTQHNAQVIVDLLNLVHGTA